MRTDILLDSDYDLVEDEQTMDFVEGESDQQHVDLLVLSQKGEWKESPFAGFGIDRRLNTRVDRESFLRDLEIELETDNYQDATVELSSDFKTFKINI